MNYDAYSFVLQRRVNLPLTAVQRGLADRAPLVASRRLDLGDTGSVVLREPLQPVPPFSRYQAQPTWCGRATALSPRGSTVANVDIEVSMWSPEATCVTVRPVARHPERWSRRRVRRYFALAHETADTVGAVLVDRAARRETSAAPDRVVVRA
ncbi:MAG TPA: hypothetical protein VH914_22165 [Acidimicrobiia bacterium]|jgi:hypothetical protein|nr:hypothetical protein [Acidimicrobiia bacterium]